MRRFVLHVTLFLCLFSFVATSPHIPIVPLEQNQAQACNLDNCICNAIYHAILNVHIVIEHLLTRLHITLQFILHRLWWTEVFFDLHILPAMQKATQQLNGVTMLQTMAIGGFFDSQQQLENQRVQQTLIARAHKDYHSSVEMCEIGTIARGLPSSDRRGEFNAMVMSRRMLDRNLSNRNSIASDGGNSDLRSRLDQFRNTYCYVRDNNDKGGGSDGLRLMCPGGSGPADRVNKDIDYIRTLYSPYTLELGFDDGVLDDDEEDVLALANYLYGHEVPEPIGKDFLNCPGGYGTAAGVECEVDPTWILDNRSVAAKRSVAHNSFAALAALKSASEVRAGSSPYDYMASVIYQLGDMGALGMNNAEIQAILGENPSYWAQMELLTKKLYMRPEFYTNLYDKPANVQRLSTAMRALASVQNMDMLESRLRSEAAMAVLLELKIEKAHQAVENRSATLPQMGEDR
jgi:hypothetical protein